MSSTHSSDVTDSAPPGGTTGPSDLPTDNEVSVDTHGRERVKAVMDRVMIFGGVPPDPAYTDKLSTWFRGLVKRGHASAELASDPDRFRRTYEEAYPNAGTRSSYVKAFMKYISGLTADEFAAEYPGLERRDVVSLLRSVTLKTSMERKQKKNASQEQK
jgi:hypothetical protein